MRTIVVTGAASGMGAATCRLLRSRGERVIGIGRRNTDIECDLADADQRWRAVDTVHRMFDVVDGVVACAGVGFPATSPASVVSVNYFGARDIVEGLRPLLDRSGRGRAVIIVSNAAAIIPDIPPQLVEVLLDGDEHGARALADELGDVASYGASKFAIARWLRRTSVQPQWAGAGIRLNGIAPGATDTPMLAAARRDPVLRAMGEQLPVPAGAESTPEQVAALVEILLSPVAELLVGQLVYHDGGTEALLGGAHWPSLWMASDAATNQP